MNAILGFSELLKDDDLNPQVKEDFLNQIKSNCDGLLNLINDIIDISNIESEKIKVNKGECFVNVALSQLYIDLKLKKQMLGKDNIKLRLRNQISNPNFSIRTDTQRFKQVLTKLLDNALKFTNDGFIEFGFKIKNSESLLFYVKDTGIGMSEDKYKLIFDKFRQIENGDTKLYGGTGIGLTISNKLVNLLGGRMWVDSKQKKGSTFYFTLPFDTIKTSSSYSPEKQESNTNFNWGDKVLLVAEDEDLNYRLIVEILKKTNAKIIRAKNGLEAVEICKQLKNKKIDLILMDIKMPKMNGYEATKKIKQILSDVPIIAQTAYAMPGDFKKSIDAGCDDYIAKPLKSQSVLSIISKHIEDK